MLIPVNFLAVLAGAIIYMVIGSLWYSPVLFVKPWMKLTGRKMTDIKKQNMGKTYGITFLMELIASYIMANMIFYTKAATIADGAVVGFFMWFGFSMTGAMINYLFEDKPFKLFAINYGYHLVALVFIGMLQAVWK